MSGGGSALQRRDGDGAEQPDHAACRSEREVGGVPQDGTNLTVDRTKSEAGVRVVGLPAVIVPELRSHLATWSEAGPNGRVFVGPKGATPRPSNFNRTWIASLVRAEANGTPLPEGLHFHDLRHTANEFAASSASVKELMARMGHSTARAALIYQRAPAGPGTRDRGDRVSQRGEGAQEADEMTPLRARSGARAIVGGERQRPRTIRGLSPGPMWLAPPTGFEPVSPP